MIYLQVYLVNFTCFIAQQSITQISLFCIGMAMSVTCYNSYDMQQLKEAVKNSIRTLYSIDLDRVDITRPEPQFGDYATNVPMQLAKELSLPPRQIAQAIEQHLSKRSYPWLASINIAGPGFINFFLTDTYLLEHSTITIDQSLKGKVVIAEYSDPNAFKSLHAGHLYTTLVGNAIANMLETVGATVYRLNYGGDVGLHAARAMWGIVHSLGGEFPSKLQDIPVDARPTWVSDRYVEGNTAYEENDTYKDEIHVINQKIYTLHEQNDTTSAFAQIYWTCRQWSYDGFKKLYKELDVHAFDEFIPESTVTPLGVKTVEEGLAKGVFEKSDGAIVYSEQKSGLHTRVFITSKGLPVYEAKELGLARYKWEKYQFDKSFVITANDIIEYMKVLFSAMSHFYPQAEQRTTHLTHGIIKLSGGRKMSSRKGNVLMAADIIESAVQLNADKSGKEDKRVAIGAIKYAFLKQRIGGDIIYDPEESISLTGNSGPYLQYAHARARSILAKVTSSDTNAIDTAQISLDPFERALTAKLCEYSEVITNAAEDMMPHYICSYLYELAVVFNRFYENSKVIGDPRESIRLLLVRRYADVLQAGLAVMGIEALDHM